MMNLPFSDVRPGQSMIHFPFSDVLAGGMIYLSSNYVMTGQSVMYLPFIFVGAG